MISPSIRGKNIQQGKQEGEGDTSSNRFSKGPSSSSSSSKQWESLSSRNNPRIVRVSRSFGGKDRHSKVCTVRGLRDRRIRLSVPTAVQLYDLQDKLGVGQPSKVIDWLLDASKLDIDMLPPLQLPLGCSFGQLHDQLTPVRYHDQLNNPSHHPSLNFSSFLDAHGKTHYSLLSTNIDHGCKVGGSGVDGEEDHTALIFPKSRHWADPNAAWSTKSKEIQGGLERTQDHQGAHGDFYNGNIAQLLYAQNAVPMAFSSHIPASNSSDYSVAPYVPFSGSEPSSLSLASHRVRSHTTLPSQITDNHNTSSAAAFLQSSNSIASPPKLFSPYVPCITNVAPHVGDDQRPQISNHFQYLMNPCPAMNIVPNSHVSLPHPQYGVSSPLVKPSPLLNVNSKLLHFQSISDDQSQAKIG